MGINYRKFQLEKEGSLPKIRIKLLCGLGKSFILLFFAVIKYSFGVGMKPNVCGMGPEAITIFLDNNIKIPYLCNMTQFTVSIADNKVGIFLEFMENLAFVKTVEKVEDFTISEEHKNIVRERVKESDKNPDLLLNWEEVKDDFILD